MKDKLNLLKNKFTNFYKSTYGMLITISWALLIICLIIKLFGGNWFELNAENSKFIQFCNYVDNNIILKIILACFICLGSTYFIICLLINKNKLTKKEILIYFPLIIIGSILGWINTIFNLIIQLLYLIVLPIIQTKKWKKVILINIVAIIFQFISIIFRNFGTFNFNNNYFIYQFLIQIDYYLMILLYYLYTFKRKEKN